MKQMLPVDGKWGRPPANAAGLRQKVFWWYPSFDGRIEPTPALTVGGTAA